MASADGYRRTYHDDSLAVLQQQEMVVEVLTESDRAQRVAS